MAKKKRKKPVSKKIKSKTKKVTKKIKKRKVVRKMKPKKKKLKKAKKVVRKKIKRKPKVKKKAKKIVTKRMPQRMPVEMAPAATPAPMSMNHPVLQEGDSAPDFRVMNDEGQGVSLSDLRGKKVVLYFYPKDDTPGCTKEACSFRDGISQIKAKGAEVLGVSVDDVDSHKRFKEKYDLNFPLLSDSDKKMVQDYGVWKEKNMYGRTFMGIERTTFLIDGEGRIARIFPKVNVEEHYNEILSALG